MGWPFVLYRLERPARPEIRGRSVFLGAFVSKYVDFELKLKKYSLKNGLYLFIFLMDFVGPAVFLKDELPVLIAPGIVSQGPKEKGIF